MAMGLKNGLMVLSILDNGQTIKHLVLENLTMLMEIFILDNGLMIKRMGSEFTKIKIYQIMKDFGKMIYNMAQEWKIGQKLLIIQEIIIWEQNLDQEVIIGIMGANIKGNGKIIR